MGAPMLFRQLRRGYEAKPFVIIKSRTMRDAQGPDGRQLPDAQRMTRLGHLLRRTRARRRLLMEYRGRGSAEDPPAGRAARQVVLEGAYAAHPERFVRKRPE